MSWSLQGSDFDEAKLIESPMGFIYPYKLSGDPVFLIVVISGYVRASKCRIEEPLPLKEPVAFYGIARYEGEDVVFDDAPRLVPRIKKVLSRKLHGANIRVYTFREAHPNVSITGKLCPGTLGRPQPEWPDELKIKHMVSLIGLLAVPNFDSALDSYGCKAYAVLEPLLPEKIRNCMARHCIYPRRSLSVEEARRTEDLLREAERLLEEARRVLGRG